MFGLFLVAERGLLTLALTSDRSNISAVILILYGLLSLHWLYLALQLSSAQTAVDQAQPLFEKVRSLSISEGRVCVNDEVLPGSVFADYLKDLIQKSEKTTQTNIDHGILLEVLGERLMAKHAFGHFASDMLLKFGLLGTIIGFIMMLKPVGELTDFDPNVLQQLLGQMSGGMAVALFTTIAGLVTSTLLALQYQLLDGAAIRFIDKVAVSVDVLVLPVLTAESSS